MTALKSYNKLGGRRSLIGIHSIAIIILLVPQILSIIAIGETVTIRGWMYLSLQITIYFGIQYLIVPIAFNRNGGKSFIIRLIFMIVFDIIIRSLIAFSKKNGQGYWSFLISFEQIAFATVQLIFVLGLSFFVGLYRWNERLWRDYTLAIRTAFEAETEKSRIENLTTQLKLSPHLLFNTLSYIKTKGGKSIPEIGDAVDLLSGILRHSMIDVREIRKVLLFSEIAEIKNQIELHRKLADGKIFIELEEHFHNPDHTVMIPPATLLTFVENMIKYGVVNDKDFPASIIIKLDDNHLLFRTWNYNKSNLVAGTGLGIKSVESTLKYYYPNAYNLDIEDLSDTFRLTLTVHL